MYQSGHDFNGRHFRCPTLMRSCEGSFTLWPRAWQSHLNGLAWAVFIRVAYSAYVNLQFKVQLSFDSDFRRCSESYLDTMGFELLCRSFRLVFVCQKDAGLLLWGLFSMYINWIAENNIKILNFFQSSLWETKNRRGWYLLIPFTVFLWICITLSYLSTFFLRPKTI